MANKITVKNTDFESINTYLKQVNRIRKKMYGLPSQNMSFQGGELAELLELIQARASQMPELYNSVANLLGISLDVNSLSLNEQVTLLNLLMLREAHNRTEKIKEGNYVADSKTDCLTEIFDFARQARDHVLIPKFQRTYISDIDRLLEQLLTELGEASKVHKSAAKNSTQSKDRDTRDAIREKIVPALKIALEICPASKKEELVNNLLNDATLSAFAEAKVKKQDNPSAWAKLRGKQSDYPFLKTLAELRGVVNNISASERLTAHEVNYDSSDSSSPDSVKNLSPELKNNEFVPIDQPRDNGEESKAAAAADDMEVVTSPLASEDAEVAAAIQASLRDSNNSAAQSVDDDLEAAIQASLRDEEQARNKQELVKYQKRINVTGNSESPEQLSHMFNMKNAASVAVQNASPAM